MSQVKPLDVVIEKRAKRRINEAKTDGKGKENEGGREVMSYKGPILDDYIPGN